MCIADFSEDILKIVQKAKFVAEMNQGPQEWLVTSAELALDIVRLLIDIDAHDIWKNVREKEKCGTDDH